MGGHNLPGIITSRKSSDDYFKIKNKLIQILKSNNIICDTPYELPNKKDYGDLDVICMPFDNVIEFIKTTFEPDVITPTISKGKLFNVSFNIGKNTIYDEFRGNHDFQIDFIMCYSNMEMYMFYFSYGDLGGILGRISNAYGFKLGESGLFMSYNAITLELNYQNTPDKLYLSDNPDEICKYFGLDYREWKKGFGSVEQVYDFILSCKIFDKNIFKTLNIDHRRRLKLRPMYMNFLKYIKVSDEEISNADETRGEVIENRQKEGIDYFKKWDIVNETKNIRLKEKERSEKYNGGIFMERGYKGKEIGFIKKKFEDYIHSEMNIGMNEFIDSNKREKIIEIIDEFLHHL